MKLIRNIVLICLMFCLAGCGHKFDTGYLVKHPEYLKSILSKCTAMPENQLKQNRACLFAIYVYQNVIQMMKNPEAFGQKILHTQMKLGDLQRQYNQIKDKLTSHQFVAAQKQKLQDMLKVLHKKIQVLQKQIDVMVRIVGISEGM